MKKKDLEKLDRKSLLVQEGKVIQKLKGIERVRNSCLRQLDDIAILKLSAENNRVEKIKIS